jgi:hypothetical protein
VEKHSRIFSAKSAAFFSTLAADAAIQRFDWEDGRKKLEKSQGSVSDYPRFLSAADCFERGKPRRGRGFPGGRAPDAFGSRANAVSG